MLDEGRLGIVADRAVRTTPDPLSALGHAFGIVMDFRARTKAKRQASFKRSSLIYQSLDCLATRAGPSRVHPETGRVAAISIWRVGRRVYRDHSRRRLLTAEAPFELSAHRKRRRYRQISARTASRDDAFLGQRCLAMCAHVSGQVDRAIDPIERHVGAVGQAGLPDFAFDHFIGRAEDDRFSPIEARDVYTMLDGLRHPRSGAALFPYPTRSSHADSSAWARQPAGTCRMGHSAGPRSPRWKRPPQWHRRVTEGRSMTGYSPMQLSSKTGEKPLKSTIDRSIPICTLSTDDNYTNDNRPVCNEPEAPRPCSPG